MAAAQVGAGAAGAAAPAGAVPAHTACVLARAGQGVPLRWRPAAHAAFPAPFRGRARAALLALRAPAPALPAHVAARVVAALAQLDTWPELPWAALRRGTAAGDVLLRGARAARRARAEAAAAPW